MFVSGAIHAIEVTKLTCEMSVSPLAIVTGNPHFGWQMQSKEQGSMQSGYEIEIKNRDFNYTS